ncbi:ATP-binding protein [Metaplanococcus flavidus]|uniref:AAA family ATPase n=1 Tax=Metaplanococcus flavidus TaxID=569883 RepID=A0ABW3L5N5_9BACL
MRIEKLTIYGFGKHENLAIDLNEELAVFYGNNEAGKTTIQQFIIQILFGFPSRNHSGSRYEPKGGGKYGGQLQLVDEQYGQLVIERIKGKAAGDVTVYFEDGKRGAEMDLKKILRDYDRASFEAIFSFSIHELQGLDRMTEEQLSRTLLASGTTGVDAITQLEAELEKDMGSLFKKGGRNPQLNGLIEELRNDEKELKEFREEADMYGPFLAQLDEVKSQIDELADREENISKALKGAAKLQQAAPLVQKRKRLEEQLRGIAVDSFPADGSRRMDKLMERISEGAARTKHLENELTALPDIKAIDDSGNGIQELLEKETEWHRFQSNYQNLQNETEELEEDLVRHLGLIGMDISEALEFDVSLVNEEKLLNLAESANKEEENGRFRDRELQDEQKKLIEAEKEMSYLESAAPTEEQLDIAAKWPEVSVKLAEAKALQRMGNETGNQLLSYILIAIGAAGVLAGVVREDMLIGILASAAASAGVWMLLKARRKPGSSEEVDDVIKRYAGRETEMETLMHKVAEHNRKIEDTLRIISRTDKKIEELKTEVNEKPAKKELDAYLQQMGISTSASKSTVIELFKTIRKVQEIQAKLKRNGESLKQAQEEETGWLEKTAAVTGQYVQSADLFTNLRLTGKKLDELKEGNRKIAEKRQTLTDDKQQQSIILKEMEAEKQKLLEESSTENVEEFYQCHLDWLRKKELQQEMELISSQLSAIGADREAAAEPDYSVEKRILDLENELSQLKKKRNVLVNERAELQQRVTHLLTDEAYESKLQNFEVKKAEFNELAQRWSINKAIIEAIRSTMADLKEKSLPAVLTKACEFFQRLTGGTYSEMEIHPDGHFEAIRTDGMRFHIAELSQATKEQAYLALRLSLAVSMQKSHPYPIIMDDPFVHFDRLRLQQVINLIKELQKDHQFIYFTCHEEMCEAWSSAQVIDVANTGRSVYL